MSAEAATLMAPDPLFGRLVGGYRICRYLGGGAMGVVYAAQHVTLGQTAAVKMLAPHLCDNQDYQQRFLREAQAGSKVPHPGLVRVLDAGALPEDGRLFILMEYLDGQTLRARLNSSPGGRLPLTTALQFIRDIAEAMDAAHQAAIIHRDLKPDNIMLVTDGAALLGERTKVLDFGLAKLVSSAAQPTLNTAGLMGTPAYMSPERCRGSSELDPRSDVYSLGCMLYELLCGRPPFLEDAQTLLWLQLKSDPVPPRELHPEIPPAVEQLVLKMLRKQANRRPTMAQAAAQLKELLTHPARLQPGRWSMLTAGLVPRSRVGIAFAWIWIMVSLLILLKLTVGRFLPYFARSAIYLQGGHFTMGSTIEEIQASADWARALDYRLYEEKQWLYRERPNRLVQLSPFALDRYEVTNQEFALWLNQRADRHELREMTVETRPKQFMHDLGAGGVPLYHPDEAYLYQGIEYQKSADGHFAVRSGMERMPVVGVTWHGAQQYCLAHNKRLPTEAEWEYAARSRGSKRFPWGDETPNCDFAVVERGSRVKADKTEPIYNACAWRGLGIMVVDAANRDRTEQGVVNMAGGVAEWVADYYYQRYPSCGVEPCRDPVADKPSSDPEEQGRRVVRGGSWASDYVRMRAAGRTRYREIETAGDLGFRCAAPAKHSWLPFIY